MHMFRTCCWRIPCSSVVQRRRGLIIILKQQQQQQQPPPYRTTSTRGRTVFGCATNSRHPHFESSTISGCITNHCTTMTRDHSTTTAASSSAAGSGGAAASAAAEDVSSVAAKEQAEEQAGHDATKIGKEEADDAKPTTANKRQKVEANSNNNNKNKAKKNSRRGNSKNNSNYAHKLGTDQPGKEVHPGSYANVAQRALFNVHLAELGDNDNNNHDPQSAQVQQAATAEKKEEEHRVKRKVALLLAYVGTRYGGFQINEGQRTLQGEIELAMFQLHLISRDNFGYPYKYGWSTSGRTDKGVHACAQVVSCKLEMTLLQEANLDLVRLALNELLLPNDICVVDVQRVSRSFCAHTQRDCVRYQYLIPSFCLQNAKFVHDIFESNLTNHIQQRREEESNDDDEMDDDDDDENNDSDDVAPATQQAMSEEEPDQPPPSLLAVGAAGDTPPPEQSSVASNRPRRRRRDYNNPLSTHEVSQLQDLLQVRTYRVTPEKLTRLEQALQMYQGTHSFHNLSKGVKANEARATRYIISFQVQDPIVLQDGMEWIPTQVLGQSFLLNQIRKMICLALDVARNDEVTIPLQSTMKRALSPQARGMKMGVAPAQGLYLDMSFYTGYNQRKNTRHNGPRGGDEPQLPDLDWSGGDHGNSNNNKKNVAASTNSVKDDKKRNGKMNDLLAETFDDTAAASAAAVARWKEFRNGTVMKHVVAQELQEGNFIKHLYIQEFAVDVVKDYQIDEQQQQR